MGLIIRRLYGSDCTLSILEIDKVSKNIEIDTFCMNFMYDYNVNTLI